ncbi:glycosyltransferase family 2 protein [Clostridium ljungdahlii]|uniref:Putative glycosyltransferase CsbB n=1 Tax=Clostridium ljungdahlii TaxID=1538 RepID=A0A168NRI4_9CLOT|nr:glycosyltransferase family 2 protein [Clostridium ljungdahlii]OAA86807.1 putative glycosyltransferase CsbB [Clostridium ljungdahlii]
MVSIIIPIYNEELQVYSNVVKIMSILLENNIEHQFVLVNDGSTDNSSKEMNRLCKDYDNIFIIELSRNFGKEAALCAALEHVSGDACVILDCDLQHPPELIPEMVRLWKEQGYDVVEGIKLERGKEPLFRKFAASTFYDLFNKVSGINLSSASDFKLLDRKVIEAWKSMHESITFFRGMSAWVGYNRIQIPFEVQARTSGKSKWSLGKLVKLGIYSVTSYTSLPLYIVAWLGIIMMIVDCILFVQTLYMKFNGKAFTGFTTVIILILGIGSCIMISLGIIGIYISKIYGEVKRRPRYLIAKKQGKEFYYKNQ